MTATAANAEKKPKKPKPRFYKIVRRMAEQMEPMAAASFLSAVDGLAASLDETSLISALASKNLSAIEAAVGGSRLGALLAADARLEGALYKTVVSVGESGADILSEVTGFESTFNATHPNVTMFARTASAELVTRVGQDVKEAIRIVTALGSDFGLTTVEQAQAIREIVGLPATWADAPLNFGNELKNGIVNGKRLHADPMVRLARSRKAMHKRVVAELRAGVAAGQHLDPAWVASMQSKYARNLLNRRARNIARTETLRAAHFGQREGWKQAIDAGVLPAGARRFWIVTPDERLSKAHAVIPFMNTEGRGMDEPFETPEGSFMDPPIRTNCRCATGLLFPGRPGIL